MRRENPGYLAGGYYRDTEALRKPTVKYQATEEEESASTIGSILGAIFCFLLFLIIVFSLCYPFTMYRSNPNYSVYSDDRWWCYHCFDSHCGSRCWYSNGM